MVPVYQCHLLAVRSSLKTPVNSLIPQYLKPLTNVNVMNCSVSLSLVKIQAPPRPTPLWKKRFKVTDSSSHSPHLRSRIYNPWRWISLCFPQDGLFQHESEVVGRDCHVWQISEAHLSPSRNPLTHQLVLSVTRTGISPALSGVSNLPYMCPPQNSCWWPQVGCSRCRSPTATLRGVSSPGGSSHVLVRNLRAVVSLCPWYWCGVSSCGLQFFFL